MSSRRDFLKAIGLVTVATVIESSPIANALIAPQEPTTKMGWMKVSRVLINDSEMLRRIINEKGVTVSGNDPDWQRKTTIEIGFVGDDFTRNNSTVLFKYNSAA